MSGLDEFLKVILAVFLPPIAVLVETGCSGALLINILLTILGYIPGIVHAVYLIGKRSD
jgi:uncharacterized membrane protein YqaE (UPF0057 family)